jgi:hypothetical protein
MKKKMFKPFAVIECKETADNCKITCTFTGIPKDNEMDRYLADIGAIYKKEKSFDLLYDATNIGMVPPASIQKQVRFMRSKDSDTKKLVRKCAIIIKSPFARAALDGIFHIKPPACELCVFPTREEAISWMRKKN